MADLWVVLTVVVFFGICVAFVRGCDLIIGPDDLSDLAEFGTSDSDDLNAEAAAR